MPYDHKPLQLTGPLIAILFSPAHSEPVRRGLQYLLNEHNTVLKDTRSAIQHGNEKNVPSAKSN